MVLGGKKGSLKFWLFLGSALVGTAALRQVIVRNFRVVNPDLALRQGANITRQARRVMAVTAHQDDLEVLAGGTLRLLSLAGSHITLVVVSAGAGQQHEESNAMEVRNQEQEDAGNIVGYNQIHFLDLKDLSLAHNPLLEALLKRAWEEVEPDLVLAMDPAFPLPLVGHPDHLAVGRSVLNLAREKKEATVLFYGSRQPKVLVDVGRVFEDKIQGILAHRSQLKTWPWVYRNLVRLYGRVVGRQAGILYGESFRPLSLPPLQPRAYLENWTPGDGRPHKRG